MSGNIPGVTALLQICFIACQNFSKKLTPKVLIIYQKHVFKMITRSISKFSKF